MADVSDRLRYRTPAEARAAANWRFRWGLAEAALGVVMLAVAVAALALHATRPAVVSLTPDQVVAAIDLVVCGAFIAAMGVETARDGITLHHTERRLLLASDDPGGDQP
jgi:anti-sigma-K factor RskA